MAAGLFSLLTRNANCDRTDESRARQFLRILFHALPPLQQQRWRIKIIVKGPCHCL